MARNRIIKPEFWADAKIGRLSLGARLLYIAMWNFADDYGIISASPRRLLGDVFENDESVQIGDVTRWLAEIEAQGMVRKYTADEKEWYEIVKWLSHQRISHKSTRVNPKPPAQLSGDSPATLRQDTGPNVNVNVNVNGNGNENGNGAGDTVPAQKPLPTFQKATALAQLKKIAKKHEPELLPDLEREPLAQHITQLVDIAARHGPCMFGKIKGWDAAEKALSWLKQDDFMCKYAGLLWLLDVKNGGKKAAVNLTQYSQAKPGGKAKNVNSNLGDGQPFPAGRTFG